MCSECGKFECPPACPNYISPREQSGRRCAWCDDFYDARDTVFICGKSYCVDCVSEMSVENILRISEIDNIRRFVDIIEGKLVKCI